MGWGRVVFLFYCLFFLFLPVAIYRCISFEECFPTLFREGKCFFSCAKLKSFRFILKSPHLRVVFEAKSLASLQ
nr:MAG TPA: hypothetical protein [Siphoviridae sp. ctEfY6]